MSSDIIILSLPPTRLCFCLSLGTKHIPLDYEFTCTQIQILQFLFTLHYYTACNAVKKQYGITTNISTQTEVYTLGVLSSYTLDGWQLSGRTTIRATHRKLPSQQYANLPQLEAYFQLLKILGRPQPPNDKC